MSHSITLCVYQINPDRRNFRVVEQTVWHDANRGTWCGPNDTLNFDTGGGDTSGVVRCTSDRGERVTVTVGVDGDKRWCDVVTGLEPKEMALLINGQYYSNGRRDYVRERQLAEYSVTSTVGTKAQVDYTVADGNNIRANVTIGRSSATCGLSNEPNV